MFTGREYLGTIQLYDYRNRTYSPKWGRFIEVDPIRFEGRDLNLYRYVRNWVMELIDPLGLYTEVIFWLPVKEGASSMGHLSIVVNGQSYSWELADNSGDGAVFFEDSISTGGKNNGNTSMNVDSSDSYIARR